MISQIQRIRKQVDQLVYQQAVSELRSSAYKLYDLMPKEIAIVEGKNES